MLALLAQQGSFSSSQAKTYINAIIMCLLTNTDNIKNKNTYYNNKKAFHNNDNDTNIKKLQTKKYSKTNLLSFYLCFIL